MLVLFDLAVDDNVLEQILVLTVAQKRLRFVLILLGLDVRVKDDRKVLHLIIDLSLQRLELELILIRLLALCCLDLADRELLLADGDGLLGVALRGFIGCCDVLGKSLSCI